MRGGCRLAAGGRSYFERGAQGGSLDLSSGDAARVAAQGGSASAYGDATDDRHAGSIGLALLFVTVAVDRLSKFRAAFVGGEAVAVGDGDASYHLQRILQTVRDFPNVATFDPLMNWPAGGACPWADGFDVLGAAFVYLVGGGRSAESAVMAAFLWPVVLGLLTVWATVDLARLVTPVDAGPFAPLAAGMLGAFMPAAVAPSMFGFTDHHVFEQLVVVVLCGWTLRRFPASRQRRSSIAWEASGALLCAIALWGFNGSVLYCGLVVAVLWVAAAWEQEGSRLVGSGAPALLVGAMLGGAMTIPAIRGHGLWVSFRYPSLLQAGLLFLAGLSLAVVVGVARWLGPGRRTRRAILASGIFALVAAVALATLPALGQEVVAAIGGWLLHRDPWLAVVEEFQPLSRLPTDPPGLTAAVRFVFGVSGLILPLTFVVAVQEARRVSTSRALAFGWFTATLVLLTVISVRFGRVAAPLAAVATSLAFAAAAHGVRSRTMQRILPPTLATALLLLGAAWPVGMDRSRFASYEASRHAARSAAREMHFSGRAVAGEHVGVLAPWSWGHEMSVVASRPVVTNGFGSYVDARAFADVEEAYGGDEDRLVDVMDSRDLGVAMGGFLLLGSLKRPTVGTLLVGDPASWLPEFLEGHALAGLLFVGSGMPDRSVPHLSRLLPRFCSEQAAEGLAVAVPLVCTFDRVQGARLRGVAEPGSRVLGQIDLTLRGITTRYRAWADAGLDGRWSMRLALPSGYVRGPIRSGPAWRMTLSPGSQVDVEVPESAVRGGEEILIEASR